MPRISLLAAPMAIAAGASVLLGLAGWPEYARVIEFCGLAFGAAVLSALAGARPGVMRASLAPAFVFQFATLLRFGPHAAALVAAASVITNELGRADAARAIRRTLLSTVTVVAAVEAAGVAHQALGGAVGDFIWPWQAIPIAAAVCAYCLVAIAATDVIVPLVARKTLNRAWSRAVLDVCPTYVLAASIAVGLLVLIDARMWNVLVVTVVPLALLYRAHVDHAARTADDHHRRAVIDSLNEGICVLDTSGRVVAWSDTLERLVGCARQRAMGANLFTAIPALAGTDLRRTIDEAAESREARTTAVGLNAAENSRVLQVSVVPVVDGMTLIWHDVTERVRTERALKRNEERLTLASEGANDGWWEWDLRTNECYFSARWRSILGLPETAATGRPDEWTDRVHPQDIAPLKEALDAHLSGKTTYFQHEHRMLHEDGTYRWYLCRGVAARGTGRKPSRIAGSLTDTTERAAAQERLRTAGFVDPLTGLCNRAVFVEGLGHRLDELKQRRLTGWFAVLYLDLDRFKVVNDSLGHLVGDELLIAVSRRLESCLRAGDALARLGGDEFAILLNNLDDEQQANAIAFRIQEALSAPFSIGGREVFTSASIGIAFGIAQYETPDEIMRDADTAMYHAKSRGKARHELFDADMHARARTRLGIENDLRRAINHTDFEVHYQPIVSLATSMCVGFESLVRWTRNGESISPATFVPIAEELGLIEPLGTWVLNEACRTFADWKRRLPEAGLECITINASSRQLVQQNFVRLVEQAVEKSGLNPRDVRIEITETALMDSPNVVAEVLRELRDFGVKIYLDDFGTGYSSLSHLHKLPVDALKIDRSFVRSLLLPERPAIVESILGLARTLGTSVVAEGIESELQARELMRLGCTHAQGYYFSRPLSMRAAEEMLAAHRPLGAGTDDVIEADPPPAYTPAPGVSAEWAAAAAVLAAPRA